MGIQGYVSCLFLPSCYLLLVLGLACHGAADDVQITRLDLTANFFCRFDRDVMTIRPMRYKPWRRLPPDTLTLTTVKLCDPMSELKECEPCVRVKISLNSTEFPKVKRFYVEVLEESLNKYHLSEIVNIGKIVPSETWDAQYDLKVTPGQNLIVTLTVLTSRRSGLKINRTHFVKDTDTKPEFVFTHFPKQQKIEVSLLGGGDATARLCYRGAIACMELGDDIIQDFNVSSNVTLKYEYFLPCLCIEVFYNGNDRPRNQICPFEGHPDAYDKDFWHTEDIPSYYDSQMKMQFNAPCQPMPKAFLCEKHQNTCLTISDAVVQQDISEYFIDSVDKDPNLCFKFMVKNRSQVKCPTTRDRDWSVSMSTQLFQTSVHIESHIPASFSAVICRQNSTTGRCEPQTPEYSATRLMSGLKDVQILLPIPCKGCCVQVWRSDVRFAYKYHLCPEYYHRHLGLMFLASCVTVFALVVVLFLICRRIKTICSDPLWRRTVLLVYSPDSVEYKNLICAFANFLQKNLGCEVILDLWDMNSISKIGILPWFYQKREMVTQQKGKVLVVWSKKSASMYERWRTGAYSNLARKDPVNLFGAAMSCLQRDLVVEKKGNLEDYSLVFFEGLCDRHEIPANFRNIPRYCLFRDLYRLAIKLQGTAHPSPPCMIKAGAKYLLRRMISSEKSKVLQHDVEMYRQKLLRTQYH
ncbi:interleukin-17 receptor E [Discoglossus pictus]